MIIKHKEDDRILFFNTKKSLAGDDLSGLDLRHANFRNIDLCDTNLSGTFLIGANFAYAKLNGANLFNTNLEYANLYCANLCNTNLRNTNLYDADLRYAKLPSTDIVVSLESHALHIQYDKIKVENTTYLTEEWMDLANDKTKKLDDNFLEWYRKYKEIVFLLALKCDPYEN